MRIRIYDTETGGNPLWDSGLVEVDAGNGVFSILLGDAPQPSIDLDFDQEYWIEIWIDGNATVPRQQLASVGYAFTADFAASAFQADSAGFAAYATEAGTANDAFYAAYAETAYYAYNTASVPNAMYADTAGFALMANGLVPGIEITGDVTGSPFEAIIKAVNTASSGFSYGLYGESASSEEGTGVRGVAMATTGVTLGVYGKSYSTDGRGVYGSAKAATGATYGGEFRNESAAGTGVIGYTVTTTGNTVGVRGRSESASGKGVFGLSLSSTGLNYGVYGRTNSSDGYGLYSEGNSKINGDLEVTGAYKGALGPNGGAPFPRPAYDSGWISVVAGADTALVHNIGGDRDDYVVDLQFKDGDGDVHTQGIGEDMRFHIDWSAKGAYWFDLTTNSISIHRSWLDDMVESFRVRIWVCN
jgi:hypothetical protein